MSTGEFAAFIVVMAAIAVLVLCVFDNNDPWNP